MFHVEFYVGKEHEPYTETETLAQAEVCVRFLKRRGYTPWVLDDKGKFVPIKGVMKDPRR